MRRNSALLALTLGVAHYVCPAQDFTANVVFIEGNATAGRASAETSVHNSSRLFVSNQKLRLEIGKPAGTVLLVNGAEQTAFAIFPAKKEYEPLAGSPSEYFRVIDAENACPDWQKASVQKLDCEKIGHEVVDGRQTVKYANRSASDVAISAVWVDVALKFVVKWEGAGTGAELHNIQEAKQTEDLFTLPSDYDVPKPKKGTNKGFSHQ